MVDNGILCGSMLRMFTIPTRYYHQYAESGEMQNTLWSELELFSGINTNAANLIFIW